MRGGKSITSCEPHPESFPDRNRSSTCLPPSPATPLRPYRRTARHGIRRPFSPEEKKILTSSAAIDQACRLGRSREPNRDVSAWQQVFRRSMPPTCNLRSRSSDCRETGTARAARIDPPVAQLRTGSWLFSFRVSGSPLERS